MKNIMVINQGQTTNIGDIAINKVLTEYLENRGVTVRFAPYFDDKQVFFNRYQKIPAWAAKILWHSPWLLDMLNRRVIKKYLGKYSIDCAVIGGGELMGDFKAFNSAFVCWTQELKKRNIPIFVLGVSGDANSPSYYLRRYRRAIMRCCYVNVRDNATKQIFQNIYHREVTCSPDIVFCYDKDRGEYSAEGMRETVVCVPVPYSNMVRENLRCESLQEYYSYLIDLILANSGKETKIVFTSTVQGDMKFVKEICDYVSAKISDRKCVFHSWKDLNSYVGLMKETKTVISGRMHAMILGIKYGANIVPIPFKQKVRIFYQEYNGISNLDEIVSGTEQELENIIELIKQK